MSKQMKVEKLEEATVFGLGAYKPHPGLQAIATFSDGYRARFQYHPEREPDHQVTMMKWVDGNSAYGLRRGWERNHNPAAARVAAILAHMADVWAALLAEAQDKHAVEQREKDAWAAEKAAHHHKRNAAEEMYAALTALLSAAPIDISAEVAQAEAALALARGETMKVWEVGDAGRLHTVIHAATAAAAVGKYELSQEVRPEPGRFHAELYGTPRARQRA